MAGIVHLTSNSSPLGEENSLPPSLKEKGLGDEVVRITVKNRIDVGDRLRMISPTQSVEFTVEKIYSLTGEEVQSAHGGHVDVYISVPEVPTEYALIRTQEDLGSEKKATKESKQESKQAINTIPKKGYNPVERKIHRISQSLQFFGVRMKSRFSRILGNKKKKK